ncbi:MAG: hypothetical protein A1D16_11040 [Flavihumibacter sp. CACIAM 22H1]|nr:MAG: hypothetical protein A1D16_11040 [Flavihumibacter sp. CACIAM 22H1]
MIRQQAVKINMSAALKGTELTTVLLQPQELRWLKPGKEIWLNNSFFDVLSIDSSGFPWKVEGLYDPEDTKLHMKLIRLLHKEAAQEDEQLRFIAGAWAMWCALPQRFTFHWQPLPPVQLPAFQYSSMLSQGIRTTSAPPPWM